MASCCGELLAVLRRFLTMDRNVEFQQPIARQSFGVIIVRARSNRMVHLLPLVPEILRVLEGLKPGETKRVGA